MILLIVSIILFAGVTAWVVLYAGKENRLTISEHVVKTQRTKLWFGIVGFLAAAFGSLGIFTQLLPQYRAGILAYVVYALIMLGLFIAALIPRVKGRFQKIHDVGAWGSCYIMPVGMLIGLTWALSPVVRIIGSVLLAVSCILLILLFSVKRLRKNFLTFQIAYLSVFFVFLLLLSLTI